MSVARLAAGEFGEDWSLAAVEPSGNSPRKVGENELAGQEGLQPSKLTRAGRVEQEGLLPSRQRTGSAGKAHRERIADPSRITQQFVRLTNPELEFRTSLLFGCGSAGVVKCRQRIGFRAGRQLATPADIATQLEKLLDGESELRDFSELEIWILELMYS